MNIWEAIKSSLLMLSRNKMRSFLTMLGIIIGVMAVVIVMSLGVSAQEYILSQVKIIGTDVLNVFPGKISEEAGPPSSVYGIVITNLKYEDGEDLAAKNYDNVLEVSMYVRGNDVLSREGFKTNISFVGTTSSYLEVDKAKVLSGRFFTEEEEKDYSKVAVLGSQVAEDLFGDSDPLGEKIKIKETNLRVIGVLEERGNSFVHDQDSSIYIPIKTVQKLLLGINYISQIKVKIKDESASDLAMEEIKESLRESHNIDDPEDDDFTVSSTASALQSLKDVTDAFKFFLVFVSAISLIVGGFGIMNIMLAGVEERVKEIGLRKAIGARNKNIVSQFLIETVVITFFSGIMGILLGIFISFAVSKIIIMLGNEWFFIIPFSSIMVAAVISILIGLIFGIYPAYKASKLNPIEALRYE